MKNFKEQFTTTMIENNMEMIARCLNDLSKKYKIESTDNDLLNIELAMKNIAILVKAQ